MSEPTVLVVDDSRGERLLLRHALTDLRSGLDILEAADDQEALALYQNRPVDLVFLDIRLPRRSGLEVLADLLLLDPEAWVVMVSHFSSREHVVRALRLGARDFVVKPFNYRRLEAIFAAFAARAAKSGERFPLTAQPRRALSTAAARPGPPRSA